MASPRKIVILRVAIRLFARDGFVATTFERIAAEAGVAFGLIRYHFGNKEKIFLAANMYVLDELAGRLRRAVAPDTGRDAVEGYVRTFLDFAREPSNHYDIFITCTHLDQMKEEENRSLLAAKWAEIFDILKDAIARGVQRGEYSAAVDPAGSSRFVICAISGAARGIRLFRFAENPFLDQIVTHILRSLGSHDVRAGTFAEGPYPLHAPTTPDTGGNPCSADS